MKTTEKPERTKDSRSRDSSPRPQTQTTTRKRARTRTATLQYYDNPELDKVKRYFIGKELQKVWGKVSYTGRQKIVKHYATLNFIICEDEVEEPPADEDNSLICQPMEPEVTPVYSKFEFEAPYNSETLEEKLCSPSQVVDFTETLKDVPLLVSPVPCTNTELTLDYDSLCLRVAIEPVFDFFEFICDDTWSKVGFP